VGEDPGDVGVTGSGAAKDQAGDRPRRVRAIFHHGVLDVLDDVAAAIAFDRVNIHDGFAAVQFLVNRSQLGIPQPDVPIIRIQADSVRLQRVERILRFPKRALGVGDRNAGKNAETAGMIAAQLRRVIVALTSNLSHFVHFAEPKSRRGDGEDGDGGAVLVHVVQVLRQCPAGIGAAQSAAAACAPAASTALVVRCQELKIGGRREVVVDINPPRVGCLLCRGRPVGKQRSCTQGRESAQEFPPRGTAPAIGASSKTFRNVHGPVV
jgi:hypothetical protein